MRTLNFGGGVVRQLEKVALELRWPKTKKVEPLKTTLERLIGQVEGVEKRRLKRARALSLIVVAFGNTQSDNRLLPTAGALMRQAATIFRRRLRQTDIVGSFGPQRLLIGLVGADRLAAIQIVENLRQAYLAKLGDKGKSLTFHYGVASFRPGKKVTEMLVEAQAALNEADISPIAGVEKLLTNNSLLSRIVLASYRLSYQRLIVKFERISFIFIAICQRLATRLSFLWLKTFTTLTVLGQENLSLIKRPVVVVANHESHLDPQLIAIGLLKRPDIFPLRYMTKNQLFLYPGFNLLIFLLGAFRAHKKKGLDKSLLTPLRTLKANGAVVMFPEGKIIHARPELGQGRRGAAILALISRAAILPLALNTPANLSPWALLTKRPKIVIRVGTPFYLDGIEYLDFSDEMMSKATSKIMSKIDTLYRQHDY